MLLPWYAAGTLDPDEMRQVEAALARDPELASRYEWVSAEFAQETAIGDAAGAPSPGDVRTLFAKIDALPARRTSPSAGLSARIAEFLTSLSPRALAWSAAAAALVIMLQAGLLAGFVFQTKSQGGYQTASAPATAPGEGSYVLIRFQPQATAADIAQLSRSQQAEHRQRPGRRPAFPGARRADQALASRPHPHRQHAAERQGRRLHRRNKLR